MRALKVVVSNNNASIDILFTYLVPEYVQNIFIGHRILVPFGKSNKLIEAFVFEIIENIENEVLDIEISKLKNMVDVLDKDPMLTKNNVKLINWMKERYICSYMDCIALFYPKGYHMESSKYVKFKDNKEFPISKIDEIFSKLKEETDLKGKISKGKAFKLSYINKMSDEGVIDIYWKYKSLKNEKKICYVSLKYNLKQTMEKIQLEKIRLGEKQKQILKFLGLNESCEINDLKSILSLSSTNSIKTLHEKNILKYEYEDYYRQSAQIYRENITKITLNEEQQNAIHTIKSSIKNISNAKNNPFLIHGVTGSGKTEVYLELISFVLKQGQSCLFLVPEIALTPQMISRVKNRFGNMVAVYHSGLSAGERHDVFRLVKKGRVNIVIGARSALFLPFNSLGLILVDECHESSYQSEFKPKYNAVEIARYMAYVDDVCVVMGSATPSVSDYYNALKGNYELIKINKRANNMPLPKIEVIDMKNEPNLGNTGFLSYKLLAEIKKTIAASQQVILFLNRRGYANFVSCKTCGHVFKCKNCDISLTYHKYENKGVCHYCGYSQKIPKKCPECNSENIGQIGFGTQRVEEELKRLLNDVKVLRLDKDTVSKKGGMETILEDFKNQKASILLGTQMLSKGLDFENVTLAAVLSADMMLNFPDFRSFETTFQLITQVAGRAGRADKEGKVFLQTYNTDNFAIKTAVNYDYESFFKEEIKIRKMFNYEPFNNIMRVVISGKNEKQVIENISRLYETLKYLVLQKGFKDTSFILGPNECSINKIKGKYRWQIMFKDNNIGLAFLKGMLKYICVVKRDEIFDNDIQINIDINPNNVL